MSETIIDPDTGKPAIFRYAGTGCDHDYMDVYLLGDRTVCAGCGETV
jgi:hypothetical protein